MGTPALHNPTISIDDLATAWNAIGMELEGRVSVRFETERYPKSGNARILDRQGDMLEVSTTKPTATASPSASAWTTPSITSTARRRCPGAAY